MRATIQQIVEHISALSVPMDPELVQKIFINYPEFTSPDLPKDLEFSWTQLDLIRKLAQQGVELKEIIKDLKLHEEDIVLYTEKGIVAQSELTALELELKRLQDEITLSRVELTELYNKLLQTLGLQTTEDATPEPSPEALTKKQLKHIVEIRNDIQREIKLLTLPTAKLKLLELKPKQTELLKTITHYVEHYQFDIKIPSSINNEDEWKMVQFSLAEKLKKITELRPQLDKLQEGFADCLSTTDTQRKISALELNKAQIISALYDIDQKIQRHDLAKAVQLQLIQEFQQCTNIPALFDSYKTKVDSVLSYINLSSWTNWLADKEKYNKQQAENSLSLSFLTLLNSQKEKQQQQANLVAQIEVLTKISNVNAMSAEIEERLVSQATTLLNELPGCKVSKDFTPKAHATDYYLLLIDNILLIPDTIKQYEAFLAVVNNLLPIMAELLRYRRDYNLPVEQDELLPSIEELQKAIPEETGLTHKKEQLKTCELYIENAKLLVAKLKLQTEKVKSVNEKKKEVEFNIGQLKIALEFKARLQQEKTFATQKEEHSDKLTTCQSDMAGVLKKVLDAKETDNKALIEARVVTDTKKTEPNILIDEPPTILDVDIVQQEPVHHIKPIELTSHRDPIVSPRIRPLDAGPVQRKEELRKSDERTTSTTERVEPNIKVAPVIIKREHETEVELDGQDQRNKNSISDPVEPIHVLVKPIELATLIDTDRITVIEEPAVTHTVSSPKQLVTDGLDVDPPIIEPIDIRPIESPTKTKTITTEHIEQHLGITQLDKETPLMHNREESIQLTKWHNANLDALSKHPEELKNWYLELYAVAESAVKQIPYSHKYSHLIRDIFFELQTKQELTIIDTYKRICPTPKDNCELLLDLKPDHKISERFSEEIDEEHLPGPLKKLNSQYKNLKIRHPIAAELLLQTIQSLYSIYKGTATTSPAFVMSSITDDPRYDVLKRHRGFLRIWEAIEDFFNWLGGKVTGQPEYEYQKRPSFFKTHTEELIEEAELFVAQPKS